MRINKPISAKDADENSGALVPWPPGDYDFTVAEATDEISKASGQEMIKLILHVFNRDGQKRTVFDYLLSGEKGQWKVRHAAEAIGMLPQYEAGELDTSEMIERSGKLKLRIKPAQGEYQAGNSVVDYIPAAPGSQKALPLTSTMRAGNPAPRGGSAGANVKRSTQDIEDEVPFGPEWR